MTHQAIPLDMALEIPSALHHPCFPLSSPLWLPPEPHLSERMMKEAGAAFGIPALNPLSHLRRGDIIDGLHRTMTQMRNGA